jgi:hypothetical protein
MITAFRVVASIGASFLSQPERERIVLEAVKEAKDLEPNENDVVYCDVAAADLRVVVLFAKREVHIMTSKEAAEIGLPGKRRSPSDN